MNTLCNNCGHNDLLGHHMCRMDGEPVRVRVRDEAPIASMVPPGSVVSVGGMRFVSSKPIDSAHAKPKAITVQEIRDAVETLKNNTCDPHEMFTIGDNYFGYSQYGSRPMFFKKEKKSGIPEVRDYYLTRLIDWLTGDPKASHKPQPCGDCGAVDGHHLHCAYAAALDLDEIVRKDIV